MIIIIIIVVVVIASKYVSFLVFQFLKNHHITKTRMFNIFQKQKFPPEVYIVLIIKF